MALCKYSNISSDLYFPISLFVVSRCHTGIPSLNHKDLLTKKEMDAPEPDEC